MNLKKRSVFALLASLLASVAFGASDSLLIGEGLKIQKQKGVVLSGEGEIKLSSDAPKGANLRFSLIVDDPAYRDAKQETVYLSFEYMDSGFGELFVEVDSTDPLYGGPNTPGAWKRSGGVQMVDSNEWKKAEVGIYDARFSGRLNGADIRFQMKDAKSLHVRNLEIGTLDRARHGDASEATAKGKPNVLVIVVDDLNDYSGAYGDPNALTPNIDAFANTGLRFTKTYCQYPVCGPSRASFLSGLYPETSGVLTNSSHIRAVKPEATNMLEYFKANGYWTVSAGKIFHADTNPVESGRSTYQSDWFHDTEEFYLTRVFQPEFEARVGPVSENRSEWDKYRKENYVSPQRVVQAIATDETVPDLFHLDAKVRTRIVEHLESKAYGDRPFFIACGFTRPHVPHFAPERFFDLYPVEDIEFEDVPEDVWANRPMIASDGKYKGYGAEFGVNDRKLRAKWLQSYLACISFADEQVGKVLAALEATGQADNTIVVFMSDHGYHIGEHFMYGKVTLFEESARVPFVVRVPGMTEAGAHTDAMTELVDLFPSLVELCGLEMPKGLDGNSFVPVLKDPTTSVDESAYTVVRRGSMLGKAVRYKKWRYAEWGSPEQAELYDLESDPSEYNNLANNPEYSDVVKQLQKKLQGQLL